MRTPKAPILAVTIFCLILAASAAGAGEVALTRSGTLYRVDLADDGLMMTTRLTDGSEHITLVPQTAGTTIEAAQVGIDEFSQTPFILWQQGEPGATQLLLASYRDGTWSGPTVVAGDDGSIASNPEMLIHRGTTTMTDTTIPDSPDGESGEEVETTTDVSTTFVHLVWWSQLDAEDVGIAMYSAIPLTDEGAPDVESQSRIEMVDLAPYGIGCSDITDAKPLAHPKLFHDPATGAINAMAADFTNCLFQVATLDYQVDDWDSMEKRGRHSVIFGRTTMIAINPDLPLGEAEVKVGRDLSLVMYWDAEQSVAYTQVDEDGWSEVMNLAYGAGTGLDHEQAVSLIQELAH